MRVLLLQLDGLMPNIALMRLAAHHRANGDEVVLWQARRPDSRKLQAFEGRGLFDEWGVVYASTIFTKTMPVVRRVRDAFPGAIIGGTGVDLGKPAEQRTTLETLGIGKQLDYSIYPACTSSIGFSQRGCRLSCEFCDVPAKEGKNVSVASIRDIWRGEPWPRNITLLDNDFFGQPEWRERCHEIIDGDYRVCFTQGINARMLNPLAAQWLGRMRCMNNDFKRRRIYTAWDNIGDEATLFRGLKALVANGFTPDQITVYMLIGWQDDEEDRLHRHRRLREFGCRPFPMPYVRTHDLVRFQTWIVGAYDKRISWAEWMKASGRPEKLTPKRIALPLFN